METLLAESPHVTYQGQQIEPDHILHMEDSTPLLGDADALRSAIREKGYIYLPGYLGRERVIRGRRVLIGALDEAGALDPAFDPMEGVLKVPYHAAHAFAGGVLGDRFPGPGGKTLHEILYDGPMIEFFARYFGETVLHYDFTWTRQVHPGPATPIHSDVIYMGRGTHELLTAWTPFGDNGFDIGGLLVLEGSNNHKGLAKSYWKSDIDSFCENKPDSRAWGKAWGTGGSLMGTANQLRKSLGYDYWRTADYKMGDVVIFSTYTVHGGTDNHTDRVRLSTDTRYQPASAPADERWIGANPPAHGPAGKRGKIC